MVAVSKEQILQIHGGEAVFEHFDCGILPRVHQIFPVDYEARGIMPRGRNGRCSTEKCNRCVWIRHSNLFPSADEHLFAHTPGSDRR